MLRFYAVPRWVLSPDKKSPKPTAEDRLEPQIATALPNSIERALDHAEYRGSAALESIEELLKDRRGPQVLASPPNDLPALLRTADQLVTLARQDVGEKARVWRCECGTHYAVPVALIRPVSIRCERCGRTVDFELGNSLGEQNLSDLDQDHANTVRHGLADFFREAMARGWPVLVSAE